MSVPAPDASVFSSRRSSAASARAGKSRKTDSQRLFMRQTMIPILLTLGIGLPLIGSIRFVASEDSAFREIGWWFTYLGWAMGIGLLILALLNMFAVRRILGASKS